MNLSRLALVGFGSVGQGLAQILQEQGNSIAERFDIRFSIVAVSTLSRGSVYDPNGLPLDLLLGAAAGSDLTGVPAVEYGWSVETIIDEGIADTLVEVSYTDLQTGEPALSYIRRAIKNSKHIVTANKGPIALCLPDLRQLARANKVRIGFEGTVMSGTPALAVGKDLLTGAGINRVQGIFNGTTNFILTQMENGSSYEEALADAQSRGYAEADPTGDVEGYDTAGKVVILGNLLLDSALTMADIDREGITGLTLDDIQKAKVKGTRWKLIGTVEKVDAEVVASVRPMKIPVQHPLASVSGVTNAVIYSTALLGDITLIGPGAGPRETGYALINDLLAIHNCAFTDPCINL